MSKARVIGVGVVVTAIGAGGALFPIDEEFSDFGLGRSGVVTVECGTAFSDDVRIVGDPNISIFDPVFIDGDNPDESATTFCDRKRSSNRLIAILGLVGGAVVLLAGLFWPSTSRTPERPHVGQRHQPQPQQRPVTGPPPPAHPVPPAPPAAGQQRPPPPHRSEVPMEPTNPPTASTGSAWWSQPIEHPSSETAPHPPREGGPIADPSVPAGPAAPIPDSVVGSLPGSPVSGRLAPVADPTPAASPAPIPDEVLGEYRSSEESEAWGPASDETPEEHLSAADHDATGPNDTVNVMPSARFELSDGQLILVDDVSVVGRSPSPPASHPSALLVTVDDRTVSKSHAAFGRTGGTLWVEDLHSRNGLVVIRQNGTRETARPGETTPLAVGDSVRLGVDTAMTVTLGRPRTDDRTEQRQR